MNNFSNAVKQQHTTMIVDAINDGRITDDNLEDLHHEVFNTDYFIIGYYDAEKWIIENFGSVFSAVDIVREYEVESFGEFNTPINSERIAGMLSYIAGELVISELGDFDSVGELIELLE